MSHREGVWADLTGEPWITDLRVAGLLRHYRWIRIQNMRYVVYLSEGAVSHRMVITLDQQASEQPSLSVRRIARFDSMTGKLWR
jgi:hypothetical protein